MRPSYYTKKILVYQQWTLGPESSLVKLQWSILSWTGIVMLEELPAWWGKTVPKAMSL